ncbi:hypothetical protein [Dysosmobacter sp.]|uniref:hypothetical protein n=1 Tax=Dysosmobacter sp. TaxID=2591382 RepID=UPI002A86D784|nr:hypothetical protein [Dysosmobacter sp.]MDY3282489.1 hypothetical protein [Dysosmobacter sp.]
MIQAILILLIFIGVAFLMFKNKLPTFLALLVMGLGIAVVGGAPLIGENDILNYVIGSGTVNMASSVAALISGAWLGEILMSTGVSEEFIYQAAKLARGRSTLLAIILSGAVVFLFTAVNGLGAVIMLGTLVLPIWKAAGIDDTAAGVMMNYSKSLGGMLNLVQWSVYAGALGIAAESMKPYGITVLIVGSVGLLVFIFLNVYLKERKNPTRFDMSALEAGHKPVGAGVKLGLITPLIPLVLILGFSWPIVAALLLACFYAALVTSGKQLISVLNKTAVAGCKSAAPSIWILTCIGIVILAVKTPGVSACMGQLLTSIMPTSRLGYIILFSVLAPLSLYRGPMSIWGMGSGLLALIVGLNVLPVEAVLGAFMACHLFATAGDPTFSLQIWIADKCQIEAFDITKKSFLYLWVVAVICIVYFGFCFV